MSEKQEPEKEDKNKQISPGEQARGQKTHEGALSMSIYLVLKVSSSS